ncbi:hypothetical protein [Sphingobium aquiterrae]|uniref:hypothetical protein n=1 Tax=Sphingobium aquiterrae TaxID=2038656 RepID=UPI00301780FC
MADRRGLCGLTGYIAALIARPDIDLAGFDHIAEGRRYRVRPDWALFYFNDERARRGMAPAPAQPAQFGLPLGATT